MGDEFKQGASTKPKNKPRSRTNRAYLVGQTMKLAREYLKKQTPTSGKRRQRGSIKAFLKTKPVSQDKRFTTISIGF